MPLDALSYDQFMTGQAPAAPAAQQAAAPAWTPPPGAPVNVVPVIDVGGTSGAPAGQPGSQFAPSQIDPGAAPQATSVPTPDLDAAMARLRATPDQPGAPAPAAASAPAVAPPLGYDEFMALPERPDAVGKRTGMVANIGAGTAEAVSGLLGLPVDVAARVINLGVAGINAATGAGLPLITNPAGGSHTFNQMFGVVGANPENVAPAGAGEEMARAAARGVTGVALPGGVARMLPAAAGAAGVTQKMLAAGATPRMAVAAGTGGVTGQAFADVVPDQWKDVADTAGQIAGGGLALGAEAAARGLARVGAGAARSVAGPLGIGQTAAPVIDPATGQPFMVGPAGEQQPVTATPWQRATAGTAIARAAGQEPGALAASVPPQPGLVPGVQHTMGTVTGDLRLLGEERRLRNTPPGRAAFSEQEAQNNLARVAALDKASPAEARDAASQWMRAKLAAMQAEEAQAAATGRAGAEAALERAGAGATLPGVQEIGQGQQNALEAQRVPAKLAASHAMEIIDPEGTLALDTSNVAKRAKEIIGGIGKGGKLADDERSVLDAALSMRGVQPFSDLRALLSNTAEAMRTIRRSAELGPESKPFRRMTMLMEALQDSMADAAGRAAGDEVAGGMAPGGRIIDRLRTRDETGTAGTAAGRAGPGMAEQPAGGPSPAAGAAGAGGGPHASGGGPAGPGGAGRNPGVAAAPATPLALLRKPENLLEFLTARGGIKPDSDLQAMGADAYHHRAGGRLLNKNGQGLDYAREAAVQEGFLSPQADINELKDKIAEGLAGRHVYRQSEAFEAHAYEQARREQDAFDAAYHTARGEVLGAEDQLGMHLSRGEIEHAISLRMHDPDIHPQEALRTAAAASEDEIFQRNAQRDAFGHPGLPAGAEQTEAPLGSPLRENFNPEDRQQVRQSNRQYAEYKDTFRRGVVGDILRPGARPGEFATGAASVPGLIWRKGPAGADVASEFIDKFGPEAAQKLLGDYPALTLRNQALANGEWNQAGYNRWRAAYAPVLAKFPEIAAKFQTAAEAQRSAEDAAIRGQQRIEEFENSAARYYLGKTAEGADAHTAIQKLMGSENSGAAARDLMRRAAGDDAALDGIRRNTLEWLMTRARATAEAGTSGEKEIAGATMQRLVADPKVSAALRAILKPDQMRVVLNDARDLQLAARAWNAVKVPGSPGTAADLHAAGHSPSQLIQVVIGEKAGEALGHIAGVAHGVWGSAFGAAGAVAGLFMRARRAGGMASAEQLQIRGMLNPALGRVLLQDAVKNPKAPILRDTARRIVTLGAGIATTNNQQRHP